MMRSAENIITKIKGKAVLAPMLATTDIPFRRICREFGAALTCTEMVSAAGILRSSSRSFRNAVFGADEHPIAVQLVIADAEDGAAAAAELQSLLPDLFDINCGCPNDRICEAGAGAHLLEDLSRFGAIIAAVRRVSTVPVSVKVRNRGFTKQQSVRDIVRTAQDSGADMITIHARTRNTPYDVAADWTHIAEAVSVARIPVIGNGDIFSAGDAFRMLRETGCHAVMIARGSLGTPWIFRDIARGHSCGIRDDAPSAEEMHDLVQRHLAMIRDEFGPVHALPRMRKHALWYARYFTGTDTLRKEIFSVEDATRVLAATDRYFSAAPTVLPPDSADAMRIEHAFRERVLYWTTAVLQTEG
jgi:nifR3 family TIM-barrel protein